MICSPLNFVDYNASASLELALSISNRVFVNVSEDLKNAGTPLEIYHLAASYVPLGRLFGIVEEIVVPV